MQKLDFEEAVDGIVAGDERYSADAYVFLRDALDFALKDLSKGNILENRHVSGPQLLDGFRRFALQEFGPMAVTVLDEWGVRCCEDVGEMVFNLIECGVFGKTDDDDRKDFAGVFDFETAFSEPYLPSRERAEERESAN